MNLATHLIQDGSTVPTVRERGLVFLILGATLLLLHLTNPHIGFFYGQWESAYYVASVDQPLAAPVDPYYSYRLLPALFVRLLPVAPPVGFVIIDYLCLFGAAYLLYMVLRHEKIYPSLALLCSILFLSFPCSTKWLLAYSPGPDALYLFLIAAAYRCIQLQRWWLLSIVLLLGTFNKMTIMLLWPTALLYSMQTWHGKPWRLKLKIAPVVRILLSILPSLLAFAIVHHLWPPARAVYSSYSDIIASRLYWKFFEFSTMLPGVLPQIFEFPMSFFIVFGLVGLIIVFHPRRAVRILAAHPAMLFFLVGSMILSFSVSEDSERCQPYAAVPVLYLFAALIQEEWDFYRQWQVAAPLLVMQAYLSEFFMWDVANWPAYTSHYMLSSNALKHLLIWTGAALLFVAVRRWFKPSGQVRTESPTPENLDRTVSVTATHPNLKQWLGFLALILVLGFDVAANSWLDRNFYQPQDPFSGDPIIKPYQQSALALAGTAGVSFEIQSISAGIEPRFVVTADFNEDGALDLAVTNNTGILVFLGDGEGHFDKPKHFPAGPSPNCIAIGDFNGDQHLDIVVTNIGPESSNSVSVLLGDGRGNFGKPKSFPLEDGGFPNSIAVVDFNKDGYLDLVIAQDSGISILLGNGAGGFDLKQIPLDRNIEAMAVGDFDNDQMLGLALARSSYACGVDCRIGGKIELLQADEQGNLKADEQGNFVPTWSHGTLSSSFFSIAAADINQDGHLDLITILVRGGGYVAVAVFFGDGQGGFNQPSYFTLPSGSSFVGVGDFNNDGNLDVVATQGTDHRIAILLSDGQRNFRSPIFFDTVNTPNSIAIGDFNGDGLPDLVITHSASGTISLLLNTSVQ